MSGSQKNVNRSVKIESTMIESPIKLNPMDTNSSVEKQSRLKIDVSEQPLVLFKTPLPYISNLDNPRSGFISTPEMNRQRRTIQKLSPTSLSSTVSLSSPTSQSSHESPSGHHCISPTHRISKSPTKQGLLQPLSSDKDTSSPSPSHHLSNTSINGTRGRFKDDSTKEAQDRHTSNIQTHTSSFARSSVPSTTTTTTPTPGPISPLVEDITKGSLIRSPSFTRTNSMSKITQLKRQQSSIRGAVLAHAATDPSFMHSSPYARKGIPHNNPITA